MPLRCSLIPGSSHLFPQQGILWSLAGPTVPVTPGKSFLPTEGTVWPRGGRSCPCDPREALLPTPVVHSMCSTHPSQLSMATGAPLHPDSLLTPGGVILVAVGTQVSPVPCHLLPVRG